MPELNERDLHEVFRTAGHHAPARDLTDRIMARVAVTPIARPLAVKPVIGTRGWIGIAAGTAALVAWSALGGTDSAPSAWTQVVADRVPHFALPAGNWPLWLAIGSGTALLCAYLDTVLRTKVRAVKR